MQIGNLSGIRLKINNWLLLLSILFAFSGLGAKIIIAFSAVLWHEAWHVLTALFLGLRIREIELLPFGGVAYIDGLNEAGPNNEILIAAAGPISSLVLAAAAYWIGPNFIDEERMSFFLEINIMLALFNLLPALPLDGSRILRSLFNQYISYEEATYRIIRLTKVISACLVVKTVYDYLFLSTINITFCLAAAFLYSAARAEGKVLSFRRMKVLAGKKAKLSEQGIMPTIHYTALHKICVQNILRLFGPNHYYIVLVLDEKSQIKGTLTETEIWEGTAEKGIHANIGQFLS